LSNDWQPFFTPGSGQAHTLLNDTEGEVRLLVVGEGNEVPDKIFYPLHPKRNEECKAKGFYWENHPQNLLGSHDGLTKQLRDKGEEGPNGP